MKKRTLIITVLFAIAAAFSGCGAQKLTLATYGEPLDFHTEIQKAYLSSSNPANLDSSIDGKTEYSLPEAITLEWSDTAKAEEYRIEISESSTFKTSLTYTSDTTSADIYNLKIATKYYWRVTNATTNVTSQTGTFSTVDYGPRNLYVDGVTNVRDVGGWVTGTGDRTVQGLLYRGGRLNDSYPEGWVKGGTDTGYEVTPEITARGADTFKNLLGIKTEVDLRTRDRNGYPGTTDENEELYSMVDGVTYVSLPMDGGADILNATNQQSLKQLFELLADKDSYPVYYHCNIGTDRTGMVTFLLNALCGVGEQDLYFDYMFSDFGVIALPTPQVANPERKELTDLTTSTGTANRLKSYAGSTLVQRTESYLESIGIGQATYNAVRDIMLGLD